MGISYLAQVIAAANVTRITFAFNLRSRVAEKQEDLGRCKSLLADLPDSAPAFLRQEMQDAVAEYIDQLAILQGALAYVQDGNMSMISASDIALIKSIK